MVPSRWRRIGVVVSLGLSFLTLMCATASAQVFSVPKNISNSSSYSITPQVAVDAAGNIDVAWVDDTAGNRDIFFSRWTNGDATFSKSRNISDISGMSLDPRMAVDTLGVINVVWVDNTSSPQAIFFSRSTDGANFSTPLNLSGRSANSTNPQIAVDTNGSVHVVWENDDVPLGVFYTQLVNGGTSFSPPVNLATNLNGSVGPQLGIDGSGDIFVVWEDDFNNQSDISFSRSLDKGATFSAAKNLSNNPGKSSSPQVAVDANGNIDVSWIDTTPGNAEVFFSRSTDQGVTFAGVKNVSNGTGTSTRPQISADAGGNIYLVWQADVPPTPHRHIFVACSSDGGATFSSSLNLSGNSGDATFPWLSVDAAGNVNVGWTDTDTAQGNTQIFFTQSTDHGAVFPAKQNLSNDDGFAADVQMAADSKGNLEVTWSDDASGVSQIYFSRYSNPLKVNHPPVANAGLDQTLQCAGSAGTPVILDASASSDPDGDTLAFLWKDEANNVVGNSAVVPWTVSMGTHTFTVTVTDTGGLSSTAVTHVIVKDTNPPTLRVSLSPNVLRPREHRLVLVAATIDASDLCDPKPTVKLVSIFSNDPDDRGHRGRRSDVQAIGGGPVPFGTDVRSFLLRPEESERGRHLVYTITYSATDASGNTTSATAQVRVAHHTSDDRRDDSDHESRHNGDRDDDDHSKDRSTGSDH